MEDLRKLAPQAFRLALERCDESCRDYHATWPYRRLAGTNGGVEVDRHILVDMLRARDFRQPVRRVAIAGAADTGILDVVDEALGQRGRDLAVTVIDRCATPLALCELYAASRSLTLRTRQGDLREIELAELQDAVLLHSVLLYVPAEEHAALLRRLCGWLAPGGLLLLSHRIPVDGGLTPERAQRRAASAVTALTASGIPLPEPAADFARRLAARVSASRAETAAARAIDDPGVFEALVREAGLRLRATIAVPPRPADSRHNERDRPRMVVVAERPD